MPDFVTLYSFKPSAGPALTVIRSTTDPTYISYYTDTGSAPGGQPPEGTIVSVICQPGTTDRYTYEVIAASPYAKYIKEANSPFCGYVPPACDIVQVSFVTTDETGTGLNNGTANLFCTSSYMPITYFMSPPLPLPPVTNTTGYFTNLEPGTTYYINATDTNGCSIHVDFIIKPFSIDDTHYKYRLQFPSADATILWELQLYDMLHSYDKSAYPIDITGATDDPVVMTIGDPNEDKFTPIVSRQLDISLEYTGLDFIPSEFSLSPEQSWLVQLVNQTTGAIEFKGWLIPDEIQDQYSDAPYIISLKATDGLPSLKGNLWGNGSGGLGYGTFQIQQYGLTRWCLLVKQCLDQLQYDYGTVHIVSSLEFNGLYTTELWREISTWSDILYDGSGVAMATYDALSLLLTAMKLTIFQYLGEFYLVNWNDLYYINNAIVGDAYGEIFYLLPAGMGSILNGGLQPEYLVMGFDQTMKMLNPPQTINYDKPYNIENDVSFDVLSLLYTNPSFEIGAVQGQLPIGFGYSDIETIDFAYCNYDPISPTNPLIGAADGNWELRFDGQWTPGTGSLTNFITFTSAIVVDQPGMLVNISFQWRPAQVPGSPNLNTLPEYALIFVDGGTGIAYAFAAGGANHWYVFTGPGSPDEIIQQSPNQDTSGDYTSWQTYSSSTIVLPGTQVGTLQIQFYMPGYFGRGGSFVPSDGTLMRCDIDDFQLSLGLATPATVNQTGEQHISTAVTGIPVANLKQNTLSLFTFGKNKRTAGNIFFGTDYLTGQVANLWSFALKTNDPPDRLPATITKAYARQYQRCMNKFEGDISCAYIPFYAVFGLRFMEGTLFMPFSIVSHLRTNVHHVVLEEIVDSDAQNVYSYVPIYQRASRQ